MKALLSGLSLLVFIPLIQAQTQTSYTLDQVFANMDMVAKTFRSSQADIVRTHVTVLVNDKDVSAGRFYYVRQGKEPRVKLELAKPNVQQLLIDKGQLQIYTPNLKQVQRASVSGHQDKVEMFMALGFGQTSQDLLKNFSVSLAGEELIDGRKTSVLELKPKNSAMFKLVQMWMDQKTWVSIQIKTTEPSGDYQSLKFSAVRLNSKIPESVFNLKLPKDVQVLKM